MNIYQYNREVLQLFPNNVICLCEYHTNACFYMTGVTIKLMSYAQRPMHVYNLTTKDNMCCQSSLLLDILSTLKGVLIDDKAIIEDDSTHGHMGGKRGQV